MRQLKSSSFKFHEPDEIGQGNVVERFISATKGIDGKLGDETWACAWAPDNSYFAWSSGHRILHLIPWDAHRQKRHDGGDKEGLSKRKYHIIDCSDLIWSLAFGSGRAQNGHCSAYGGRYDPSLIIATGLGNGKIRLWNCTEGTLIIELLDHRDTVRCLNFSNDGNLQLISASRDGSLKLWDIPDGGNMYSTFKPHGLNFIGCRFAPNARFIAAVGTNRMAYLWKSPSLNSQFVKLDGHYHDVSCCDFSPDSALLATGSYDTKVIVWSVHKLTKLLVLGHMFPSPSMIFAGGANGHYVRSVAFCPNGLTLTTMSEDGYARYWDLSSQPDDPYVVGEVPDALCGQLSPDGSVLSVGFRDGDVIMLSANQSVPPLMHLSRQAILKHLTKYDLQALGLPKIVQDFLSYCDLTESHR
ncbi:WD repeat and socs box-containing protein 1 [Plakobranchus ocellatus]|uniref:WD repeat and socs box-containing protein 1 n=1 Tax=Plakobranchus ocellatus TaxID=259542 RepID=A0AAV4AZK3_9GAST|nr:WD repeat and socs box-containing protein 1 [Plakobranchus ocellatus]